MEEKKEEIPLGASFVKNSFWSVLTTLFAKIGGMIFSIILARILLPEKFGIYNLALSIVLSALSLINIATNQTISRYISYSLGKKDTKKAKSYYVFLSKIKFILSISLMIILIIIAYPLSFYVFNKPGLFLPLLGLTIYVVTFSFQNLYETIFYVLGKVNILTIKESLIQFSKIIICLFLFVLLSNSILIAIFSIIIASCISIIFMRVRLKKIVGFLFNKTDKGKINKPKVLNFLKQAMLSSMSATLFDALDVIILGIFVTSSYVGYYSSAYLIVGGFFGLITFSNISLPVFTKMDKQNLQEMFGNTIKYLSFISIPIIFGIMAFGRYVIQLLYGYEYLEAFFPLLILSLLIFEFPLTDNLKALLLAKEKPKQVMRIIIFATILNLILTTISVFFLIKISMTWAMIGAAASMVINRYLVLFLLFRLSKKELSLSSNIKVILKPIFSSLIMVSTLFLINSQVKDMNLFIGIAEVIFAILVYLTVMFLIKGINKKDFLFIKNSFLPQKS